MRSLDVVEEEEQHDSPDGRALLKWMRTGQTKDSVRMGTALMRNSMLFFNYEFGGAASKVGNIEQLPEISMDETVLDVAVPNPTDDQMSDVPDHLKVENDLVGKKACIAYLDNLKLLTSFLQFPMKVCTFSDQITLEKCPGRRPFQVEMKSLGTGLVLEWSSRQGGSSVMTSLPLQLEGHFRFSWFSCVSTITQHWAVTSQPNEIYQPNNSRMDLYRLQTWNLSSE
ncbi:uncharacterized protein LOC123980745 isoform X3 [Micropterus dolomieu]|uniref:uncharacterized protein LOC123980745 isoform X3 n=1 Tax=Micropterus dolomieu TaxID=147949 RepID=UPI001E8D98AC|nr:uncharacterized protein LOC123980745 isoform X3 [Micropterus dolomieu]